jgi:LDH2 family malate/lactate/ureidoglycolate dehydrogenase
VDTARVSGLGWTTTLIIDRVLPGVRGLWPDVTVSPERHARQLRAVLDAWGMPPADAATTVDHMLYADLHGIDSHGCAMLVHYHRRLQAGALAATPATAVVTEHGSTALLDGGGGLGHAPADRAMRLAIAKCRDAGLGAVAVRNSGHFGAAGGYAALAADAGLIGIAATNTEEPAVVPTFGAEARLGTNALAFAAPAEPGRPFLLDMATSTVSLGTIARAWRTGRRIPAGWAVDARGRPVRSARRAALGRRLTPLGGTRAMGRPKGYGLAAMVEVLASILPGAERVGHFFLALDPHAFREPGRGAFAGELTALLESLRGTRPLDPLRPVLVAGDPERAVAAERRRSGIPLARAVVEDIRAVARASRAPFVLDGAR